MPLIPFNSPPDKRKQKNLEFNVRVSTSNYVYADGYENYLGTWIDCNDGETYVVAKGSFEDSDVQFRRDEVTNPFLEGKYTINALRENVTETLIVYVYGDTAAGLREAVTNLTDAFSQIRYRVEVDVNNSRRSWWCYAADYNIKTSIEFMHSNMAQVTIKIPRDPVETLSEIY